MSIAAEVVDSINILSGRYCDSIIQVNLRVQTSLTSHTTQYDTPNILRVCYVYCIVYTKHTTFGALPSSVEHIDRLSTIKINYDTHDPNRLVQPPGQESIIIIYVCLGEVMIPRVCVYNVEATVIFSFFSVSISLGNDDARRCPQTYTQKHAQEEYVGFVCEIRIGTCGLLNCAGSSHDF